MSQVFDFLSSFLLNTKVISFFKSSFYFGISSAIVAAVISPLQFLKIVRQQTNWRYSTIFSYYYKKHNLKIFFRGLIPYSLMNFYSSFAFGTSEYFTILFLEQFHAENTLHGMFLRCLMAGLLETLFTVRAEVKEISKNKLDLMDAKGEISQILISSYLRNSLFWMATVFSFYISKKFILGKISEVFVATFIGILFGIFTIPFDIVSTHNCGTHKHLTVISRLKEIISEHGYKSAYRGSIMRVVQITIFTVSLVMTEWLLR